MIGAHQTHPAADVCQLMDDVALGHLATSIECDGQRLKIILYCEPDFPEGRILDGRNRYRACLLKGIEPEFAYLNRDLTTPLDMGDLCRLVDAYNLRRRMMSPPSIALSERRFVKLCRQRKEREKYQAVLPEMTNHAADAVLSGASDKLLDAVNAGEVPLDVAAQIAGLEDEQQESVLERLKPDAVKQKERTAANSSAAIELSGADIAALRALIHAGEGSVHGIVKAGAAVLRRMVPGV